MADKIYLYPHTNCDCGECANIAKTIPKGIPSNISIANYKVPKWFSCGDRIAFKQVATTTCPDKIRAINPQLYQQQKSRYFVEVKNPSKELATENSSGLEKINGCPDRVVVSQDARLYSATRGDYLPLDEAPIESKPRFATLYTDKTLINYGQNYSTYADINAGNIIYYNDETQKDPYFPPNFPNPNPNRNQMKLNTNIYQGIVYKDPMDNFKPEYPRLLPNRNLITQPRDPFLGEYCLTELSDTTKQREEIMTCQMSKINSQRWMPRWYSGGN